MKPAYNESLGADGSKYPRPHPTRASLRADSYKKGFCELGGFRLSYNEGEAVCNGGNGQIYIVRAPDDSVIKESANFEKAFETLINANPDMVC